METREIISDNLLNLRKRNHLTQSELAQKINYSDKAISKWERGEAIPDIITFDLLAKIYNVDLNYFITYHTDSEYEKYNKEATKHKVNKIVISLLAITFIWIIATTVFVTICTAPKFYNMRGKWLCFIWAIPATGLIAIMFNHIWGKRKYVFFLVSFLLWTLIISIYLQLIFSSEYNIWLLFIIGIPAELSIILWSHLYNE